MKSISRFGLADGHRVVFSVDKRHRPDARAVSCFITEVLGHVNDPGVDVLTLVRQAGIPVEFPENALEETKNIPNEVSKVETENRLDLRDEFIFTIDGDDTKDIDDAISFAKTENGFSLGVHIADVTHYVKENSALDAAALNRGTSIYLADRVIPMLPHKLSSGICSLFPDVDRLSLSCMMNVNKNGDVVDYKISESVIRSKKRFTYTEVQNILDTCNAVSDKDSDSGENSDERFAAGEVDSDSGERFAASEVDSDSGERLAKSEVDSNIDKSFDVLISNMDELREILNKKRQKRGALDFDLPEAKIRVDKNGRVISIEPYPRNNATGIIEEFMILCNETIAAHFFSRQTPFVYRSHEAPSTAKVKSLQILAVTMKIPTANNLQKLLESAKNTPAAYAISTAVLQAMPQANYTHTNPTHFGLASQAYCHFTSPIRRYADLQIHRVIRATLGEFSSEQKKHFEAIFPEVCAQCSRTERAAEALERDVAELKKTQFMADKIDKKFKAIVSGVASWGVYVMLENTAEGLVPAPVLLRQRYKFYKEEAVYKTKRRPGEESKILRHGSEVVVRLVSVNEDERRMNFVLLEQK